MKQVRFSVDAPNAQKVFLAGDFTDWEKNARPMRRSKAGGSFVATVTLPKGRHEYKFIVDGSWHPDPKAQSVQNRFGTHNSVVKVDEVRATVKRRRRRRRRDGGRRGEEAKRPGTADFADGADSVGERRGVSEPGPWTLAPTGAFDGFFALVIQWGRYDEDGAPAPYHASASREEATCVVRAWRSAELVKSRDTQPRPQAELGLGSFCLGRVS